MPVATSTELNPGLDPIAGARVIVRLVTSPGNPWAPGYVPSDNFTVAGEWETNTDDDGVWSTPDVPSTVLVVPANSVYVADIVPPNRHTYRHVFLLPNSPGPHRVEDNLADPPADMPTLVSDLLFAETARAQAAEAALASGKADSVTSVGGPVARVNEGPLSLLDPRVGCLLDGSDEGAKLSDAVAMLPTNGGKLFHPGGTLGLSSFELLNRQSVTIEGVGRASKVAPVGAGTAPTVKVTDCRDTVLRSLWITGRGATATSVVESHRSAQFPTYNGRGMVLDSLFLGSTGANNALTGLRTTAAALADSNNDIHDIRNVEFANLIDAAMSFEHYNSLCHTIYGGKVASCGRVVRTLAAGGGAFTLVGGFFENVATLFDIGGACTHPFMAAGFGAEGCGQILRTATAEVTVFLGPFGFYGSPTGTLVIDFASSGYLSLEGWVLTGQPDTHFRFSHAGGRVVVKSGSFGISNVDYNGALQWPAFVRQLSGIAFTNLGSGVLN